jgi:hypothetical protein
VRRSENEGVTLAEILSQTLSADELDEVQSELAEDLSEGYESICEFMGGVDVPSLEDIMESEESSEAGFA